MIETIAQWIATTSHSIKIQEYVAGLFKKKLGPKEQLGVGEDNAGNL